MKEKLEIVRFGGKAEGRFGMVCLTIIRLTVIVASVAIVLQLTDAGIG